MEQALLKAGDEGNLVNLHELKTIVDAAKSDGQISAADQTAISLFVGAINQINISADAPNYFNALVQAGELAPLFPRGAQTPQWTYDWAKYYDSQVAWE